MDNRGLISTVLGHGELEGKIEAVLLLDQLKNAEHFLILPQHHEATIYHNEGWYLPDSNNSHLSYHRIMTTTIVAEPMFWFYSWALINTYKGELVYLD